MSKRQEEKATVLEEEIGISSDEVVVVILMLTYNCFDLILINACELTYCS